MQLSTSLTLLAMAAGAFAQGLQITDSVGASVLQVLATAIPPESISQATADPAAFSAELASSLSAGNTPSWYQALPSDVKSYLPQLYPAETPAETTAESTAAPTTVVETSVVETTTPAPPISGTSAPTGGNTTVVISSPTLGSTGGANSDAPTSTSSEAGAAMHTGMVGAGLVGAMGFLLAL